MKSFNSKKDSPNLIFLITLVIILTSNHKIFCPLLLVESCNAVDKEALLDFKSRITSDRGGLLQSWDAKSDCCATWDSITCDAATGRVVGVSITPYLWDKDFGWLGDTIAGTLSPFMGNLTGLIVLTIHSMLHISGPIPPQLGKLSNLTSLDLGYNDLSGSIPASLGNLHKLEYLYLSNNRLSGKLPLSIFYSLRSLSSLYLGSNELSGSIPSSIANLTSLSSLNLESNRFTGHIPSCICDIVSLRYLYLNHNNFSGALPSSIGKLSHLRNLKLQHNKFISPIPSSIDNLVSLYHLNLSYNEFTGVIPNAMAHLSNLEFLSLSNNHFVGKIPSYFGSFKKLRYLDLSNNQLVGPLPRQLANLKSLYLLNLSYNPLRLMSTLKWIANMTKIEDLVLAETGIKGKFPESLTLLSIKHLDLSSNKLIGKLPSTIGNMTNLESLNLSNNCFYSTIPSEFKKLRHLDHIDLHSNKFSGSLGMIFDINSRTIDVSSNKFTGPLDKEMGNKFSMKFVTSLVLSNNPLGGTIPNSIENMTSLDVLSMVSTRIIGAIPSELGNSQLTTILLSKNRLTGSIPMKVLNLNTLQVFDVSRNQLCGEIPSHNLSIPASAFSHNRGLCGAPLAPCKP